MTDTTGNTPQKNIRNAIYDHIAIIDTTTDFFSFTGTSLQEWMHPFIESITDDGGIPYLIGTKERYRASPLASAIEFLEASNLLPEEAISKMKQRLFYYRDHLEPSDSHSGQNKKNDEDIPGWSLAEGVSVWSTSRALFTLINKDGEIVNNTDELKKSIIWLAQQQKTQKNGWAYQKSDNCIENVPMTAVVLQTLSRCYIFKKIFDFTNEEESILEYALKAAYVYIKDTRKINRFQTQVWWEFQNKPNCYATTMSLVALSEAEKTDIFNDIHTLNDEIREKAINFIINCMPRKIERWNAEAFVTEAGAKYSKQKNYYSFSVTLLKDLFDLGLSPYNERVINQIKWLVQNKEDWKIENYDRTNECTFTFAMVLSVITKWAIMVGTHNAKILLRTDEKCFDKIIHFVLGINYFKDAPILLIRKNNLLLIFIFLLFVLFHQPIVNTINIFLDKLINNFLDGSSIINNIISNIIWVVLIPVCNKITKSIIKK